MVSLVTAAMIRGNETVVVVNGDQAEAWIVKDGVPHALMLSCHVDHRRMLEEVIAEIKQAEVTDLRVSAPHE